MADEKKTSAEKDLLKIIETPATGPASSPGGQKAAGASKKKGRKSARQTAGRDLAASLLNLIIPGGRKPKKPGAYQKPFELRTLLGAAYINRVLIGLAVLVFVNFVVNFFVESSRIGEADRFMRSITNQIAAGPEQDPDAEMAVEEMTEDPEPEPSVARNLFSLKAPESEEVQETPVYVNRLESYRLAGISVSQTPADSYAMVENVDSQITYFLKKGDDLQGIRVVEIHPDRVVLDIDGNLMDLR